MSRRKKTKRSKGGSKEPSASVGSGASSEGTTGSAPNRAGMIVGIGALFGLMLAVILLGPRKQPASQPTGPAKTPPKADGSVLEQWQQGPERAIDVSPAEDPVLGPLDAPVTIVEYSDFQCPYCKEASGAIKFLVDEYEGRVRLVFKDFPLDKSCNESLRAQLHPLGCQAAVMARCAYAQGKFWEMHDALFKLRDMTPETLDALPGRLGLENESFAACVEDPSTLEAVRHDIEEGQSLGVNATPSLFVNGRRAPSYFNDSLESIIDHILASGSP
jgi:protein-disulfide isomerase